MGVFKAIHPHTHSYATQKGRRFGIAGVLHTVGLQAGYINRISGTAHSFLGQLVGFRVKLPAFELSCNDIHGLDIKMVVDRYFPLRLNGETLLLRCPDIGFCP